MRFFSICMYKIHYIKKDYLLFQIYFEKDLPIYTNEYIQKNYELKNEQKFKNTFD